MNKRRMLGIVIGILAVYCYIQGVKSNAFLREKSSDLYLIGKTEQSGLSAERAANIHVLNEERQEPSEFSIWGEMENVTVANSELKKEANGKAILVSGRTDLLFPGYKVLDLESKTTCLISSAMAIKLFGARDVNGLEVSFWEQNFEVVDVIVSEALFFVCEASAIGSNNDRETMTGDLSEYGNLDRVTIAVDQEESRIDAWKRNQEFFGEFEVLSIEVLNNL